MNLSGNLGRFQNVCDHRVRRDAVQFSLGAQRQPMSQNGQRNITHVVRSDKLPPANRCQCFRAEQEGNRSAWARAVMNKRMHACAPDQINSLTLHAWFHLRSCNLHATMNDRLRIGKRLDVDLFQSL